MSRLHLSKRSIIIVILGFAFTQAVRAQCDSSAQVFSNVDAFFAVEEDSTVDSTNMIAPNEIASYYAFDFQQDSSRILFRIGEFALNSRWIYLNNWCLDKVYNFDEENGVASWDYSNAQLSSISRTKTISISAGDTLSFYREFYWLDRTTNSSVNAQVLVGTDNVSMSVVLVKESDGSRVLLVDSIHISPTTSNKRPCIRSWKPAVARIGFIVPSTITTPTSAYLQTNVYSTGPSGSSFMRSDILQYSMSKQHLESGAWQDYAAEILEYNECVEGCYFSLSTQSNPRRIVVDVDNVQSAIDRVAVYDVYGNLLHSVDLPTSDPYEVSVASSGVYIVVGMLNNLVVCSRLISAQ